MEEKHFWDFSGSAVKIPCLRAPAPLVTALLRSDFQRVGGDRVAVKVGVVQMWRVNDQMGEGRSV